ERMSKERESSASSARRYADPGGWRPMLRRKYRSHLVDSRPASRWITLFVDDLPEGLGQLEMKKLFSKFGVVMDAFIPRKRSKAGRLFGFVRFNCSVSTEVATQRTNGLWIQDKQLKVKLADFDRTQRKKVETSMKGSKDRSDQRDMPPRRNVRNDKAALNYRESFANVAKYGGSTSEALPVVKGVCSGNGWLYRSVVATLRDNRTSDIMLESFVK
ncbi:hypothetical protein Dimus_012071, partial [Dionaea muscipula]